MFENQSNAQNVLLGSGLQSFTGEVSSFDGSDYYKLQVNSRSSFNMSLYGMSSDINAYLLDSSSRILASSINLGSSSEAINTTLNAGVYYVKVDRSVLANNNGSSYQLGFANDPLFRNIDDKNPNGQMFYDGDFNGDGVRDVLRQDRGNWVDGVKDAELIVGKANGGFDAPIQVSNSNLF
jgi:hypothetical protein